jgi:hypothetical protein
MAIASLSATPSVVYFKSAGVSGPVQYAGPFVHIFSAAFFSHEL